MAGRREIEMGRAVLRFLLEDSAVKRGLQKLEMRLNRVADRAKAIGKGMAKAAAVTGASLAGMAVAFAKAGDKLHKLSIRTRTSAEFLSSLGFAAEQSGTSLDSVGQALFRMQRRIANATTQTGPAVRALEELGVNIETLNRLNPDEQFLMIAKALRQMPDEARATQLGFEIMGDNIRDIWPLITSDIEGAMQQARELGIVMSTEAAANAAKLSDALNILRKQLLQIILKIGEAVAGPMEDWANKSQEIIKLAIDWIDRNKELANSLRPPPLKEFIRFFLKLRIVALELLGVYVKIRENLAILNNDTKQAAKFIIEKQGIKADVRGLRKQLLDLDLARPANPKTKELPKGLPPGANLPAVVGRAAPAIAAAISPAVAAAATAARQAVRQSSIGPTSKSIFNPAFASRIFGKRGSQDRQEKLLMEISKSNVDIVTAVQRLSGGVPVI